MGERRAKETFDWVSDASLGRNATSTFRSILTRRPSRLKSLVSTDEGNQVLVFFLGRCCTTQDTTKGPALTASKTGQSKLPILSMFTGGRSGLHPRPQKRIEKAFP